MELYTLTCYFILNINIALAQNKTDVKKLLSTVFNGYDKRVRPVDDQSQAVTITVSYYMNSINGLDELTETLTTTGYLLLEWTDSALQWDPFSYNGIFYIYIPQDDVWKPDFVLQNANSKIKELGGDFYNIAVSFGGRVGWYPYEVFTTKCSIDMTYFPYDTQTCDIDFTIWSYKCNDVNISYDVRFIFDDYEEHSIWAIESSNADVWYRPSDCGVRYRLILKRKPAFYILNILFPIALISFITTVAFIIPSGSGEKIGFSVTIFLTFAVFLTIVSSQLPTNSENTAIISVYIVVEILYSVLALIISALSVRLQNREKGNINKFYRMLIKSSRYLLFQKKCRRSHSHVHIAKNENQEKRNIEKESETEIEIEADEYSWPDVCHAIDVICFWCFNLSNILTTAVVFGVLQSGRNPTS